MRSAASATAPGPMTRRHDDHRPVQIEHDIGTALGAVFGHQESSLGFSKALSGALDRFAQLGFKVSRGGSTVRYSATWMPLLSSSSSSICS